MIEIIMKISGSILLDINEFKWCLQLLASNGQNRSHVP